jgi:hypothetical protein
VSVTSLDQFGDPARYVNPGYMVACSLVAARRFTGVPS